MAKKGKKGTPPDMDYLFERHVISEDDYAEFWEGYWENKRKRDRQRYIDRFVGEVQLELPMAKRAASGSITFSRKAAEEQAKNIGGYVIRVTKKGRASKRGRYFRAIRRKRVSGK